jgi:CHASE2 domain-containing sensor protein
MKDFFISYTSADRSWAEWIAWELEAAGYSTIIQAWDFRPGENFVLEMQGAASDAERTILVLSESYLQSSFTPSEWAAAFAQDPTGAERRLVPVCIGKCEPKGVLRALIFIDLIGLDEATARTKLLEGIQDGRGKPASAPVFPGAAPRPAFPGPAVTSPDPVRTDVAAEPTLPDPQKLLTRRRLIRGGIAYVAATGFVLLAAWVGLLSVIGADDWIEHRYLSYMQRFLPAPVTREVVLVRGRDGGPLGPPGPAWRRAHAEMVDALSLAGARVVVFDLYFEETSPSDDAALAAAIQRARARNTAVVLGARAFDLDDDGRVRPRMSSVLAGQPVRWGTLGGDPANRRIEMAHRLDGGSTWRRIVTDGVPIVPSLALQAVMQYEARAGQPVAAVLRPYGDVIEIRAGAPSAVRRVVPVVDARLNLIVDVADDIRSLGYQELYAQRTDTHAFSDLRDKIVVIGYEVEEEKWSAGGSPQRYEMDVQASAIAQILHGAFLRRPPLAAQYAVILAMGALACLLRTRRSWIMHTVPVTLPAPIGRRVDIPTAILGAVVVYGLAAFTVSKSLRVVPRFTYDLAALLLTYAAVSLAARGSSRPRFPRAEVAPVVRKDRVA